MQSYQFTWNILPTVYLQTHKNKQTKKTKKQTGNQSFLFPDVTQFCVLFLKGNAIIHHKTDDYTKDLFNLQTKQGTKTSKNKYFWIWDFFLFIALRNSRAVSQSHFLLWKGLQYLLNPSVFSPLNIINVGLSIC